MIHDYLFISSPGVSDVEIDRLTVKEGASVTLPTNAKINQKDRIKWFFQNTRIAQVIVNISSCTDVQCNEGTERFRDRLKLDHQTGSLTISDIQPADSGEYKLQITSSVRNTDSLKIFNVTICGEYNSVIQCILLTTQLNISKVKKKMKK